MRFIGVLLKFTIFCLPNRVNYWRKSQFDGVEYGIGRFLSKNVFNGLMQTLCVPPARDNPGEFDGMFGNCKDFFKACIA